MKARDEHERGLRNTLTRIEQLAVGGLEEGLSANESIIVRAIMHCAQEGLEAFERAPGGARMSEPTPISRAIRPSGDQIEAMRRGELNVTLDAHGGVVSATLSGVPIRAALAAALLRRADRDLRGAS